VDVLNRYLSVISDAVLNESGTIDKYEGDAMVAFFGAPVSLSDHARRACEAALSIKEAENRLNKDLMRDAGLPSPLYTRIGINTGRMLVGNLGTDRRMDYTILGHEANLASRLEGVNKQYGTWVIISEHTAEAVGDAFLTRRLDRVRVVGVEEPVRIFQLMGRRGEETPLLREALQIFDEGLDAYEKRDFELARNRFEQVRKIYPDDSPSGVFIRRCDEFIESAPAEDWDASVKLVEK
jgi:adenylate cyclase